MMASIVPDTEPTQRLAEINQEIKDSGAEWQAALTPKALLSTEEKRKLLGSFITKEKVETREALMQAFGDLPSYFDWRQKDSINWMTPVKDQSSCGSCWAFAAVGAAEAAFNIYNSNPNIDYDLSEQQLVSNTGSCCGTCGDCSGGFPGTALNYIQNTGVADESCFPYTALTSTCNLCNDWDQRKHKITSYFYVQPNTNDAYKQALMTYGPLLVGIDASDMFLYYASGVYQETQDFPQGAANHAVVLVGWNDTGNYWIIKNSWGSSWGLNGYAHLAYGDIEIQDMALAISGTEGDSPSTNPSYEELVQRVETLESQNCGARLTLLEQWKVTIDNAITSIKQWLSFSSYTNICGAVTGCGEISVSSTSSTSTTITTTTTATTTTKTTTTTSTTKTTTTTTTTTTTSTTTTTLPPGPQKVIFRTSAVGGSYTSSTWIAYDFNGDGKLEGKRGGITKVLGTKPCPPCILTDYYGRCWLNKDGIYYMEYNTAGNYCIFREYKTDDSGAVTASAPTAPYTANHQEVWEGGIKP